MPAAYAILLPDEPPANLLCSITHPPLPSRTLDLQPDAFILPDDMLHSLQHTEVVAPMYWPSRSPRGFVPAKIQRAMQLSRVDAGRQEGRLGLGGEKYETEIRIEISNRNRDCHFILYPL